VLIDAVRVLPSLCSSKDKGLGFDGENDFVWKDYISDEAYTVRVRVHLARILNNILLAERDIKFIQNACNVKLKEIPRRKQKVIKM